MAKWTTAGCEIVHVVCTDGSRGTWDADADPAALVSLRREEQREASRRLGGTGDVVFLDWPDGELDSGLRQRWQVCYWIRRYRPDVVLGHDPWMRYRLHPDHRHAGWLACDAIVAARDPLFFPEQALPPHRPTTLLLFEADQPDHFESVGDHVDTKLHALEAHASQFRSTMGAGDADQLEDFRTRIRDRLGELGRQIGVDAAEAFKRLDDV